MTTDIGLLSLLLSTIALVACAFAFGFLLGCKWSEPVWVSRDELDDDEADDD